MPPPAAPAAGPPTWPPSAPPSSRPSKTPATCTSPKAGATTPPQPKPSTFTASIKTETDIHGTRRSPGVPLRLDGEDKDIGPDPGIYAVFVACGIKLPGRKAAEHQFRMPLLGPALQEGRALHLDRGPVGRHDVE